MTAPERGTATLAPELARRVGTLARTLVAAGRSWALYPPEHPAVRTSLERLTTAVRDAANGQAFSFGVAPDTLLIEGIPVSTREGPTTEAAAWLHARDILQMSFFGDVSPAALHDLLALHGRIADADHPGGVGGRGLPAPGRDRRGDGARATDRGDAEPRVGDVGHGSAHRDGDAGDAGCARSGATAMPFRQDLTCAFDDVKVANLLATTLAIEGQASARLAEVFGTIAPDEPRKRRVLTLARELLTETAFGKTDLSGRPMVRLESGELGVVTNEHPSDPFRPQVKILRDEQGNAVEQPKLINTWETDSRGEFRHAVVEAIDPESVAVDPLEHL